VKTTFQAESLKAKIGKRIQALLDEREMSQAALAEAIGSPKPYISRLLNGQINVGIEKLAQIEKELKAHIIVVAK
jgi:transcriptional regulator with XRE-family HTH domain